MGSRWFQFAGRVMQILMVECLLQRATFSHNVKPQPEQCGWCFSKMLEPAERVMGSKSCARAVMLSRMVHCSSPRAALADRKRLHVDSGHPDGFFWRVMDLRGGSKSGQGIRGSALSSFVSPKAMARRQERLTKRLVERKATKRKPNGMHVEPWRRIRPEDNINEVAPGLEVRKISKEGHHVIRVGKVWSKQGIKFRRQQQMKREQEEEALEMRKAAIEKLRNLIEARESQPSKPLEREKSVPELERDLRKLENELIRFKDAIYGTAVWKNMTAHTVPYSLRHLDAFQEGDEVLMYTRLRDVRSIVFHPPKAATADPEVLLKHMEFFEHRGMQRQMQLELLKLKGVKTVVYLSLIGGGHVMLHKPGTRCPFGSKNSAGGRRKKDPILAAAGCRMLIGVSRKSPWIMCRMIKLNILQQLVNMGLLFTRRFRVLGPVLEAITHLARLRGSLMAAWKLNLLKGQGKGVGGALELIIKALRNHPLHFRVKRAACECAVALVQGPPSLLRSKARNLVRRANVTQIAEEGLDVTTHFIGSRLQARRALFTLKRHLYAREDVPLWMLRQDSRAPRRLSREEASELATKGRLPWNAGDFVQQFEDERNLNPDDEAERKASGVRRRRQKKRVLPWAAIPPEVHPEVRKLKA